MSSPSSANPCGLLSSCPERRRRGKLCPRKSRIRQLASRSLEARQHVLRWAEAMSARMQQLQAGELLIQVAQRQRIGLP
jgi:hypothetical protein